MIVPLDIGYGHFINPSKTKLFYLRTLYKSFPHLLYRFAIMRVHASPDYLYLPLTTLSKDTEILRHNIIILIMAAAQAVKEKLDNTGELISCGNRQILCSSKVISLASPVFDALEARIS